MNLLFFTSDYEIGLSCLLVQQAIAIKKREKINLFCISGDTEQENGLGQQMHDAEVNLIRIKDMDKHENFIQLSNRIGQIIEENDIECVHVQNNWQLTLLTFYKYKNIIPRSFKIVYTLHGFRHNHPIKSVIAIVWIGTLLFLFANRIFIMSDYVKKRFFFLGKKMKKLYLGIDDSFFSLERNTISADPLKLIFPGQFRKGKNQDMLISAVASYIKETGDQSIRLYLPGEGPLFSEYKKQVTNLNMDSNVIFPGQCPKLKIKELYLLCNIGVVSSNTETFGQSIVEPYVLGRCVLSRKVGVATDILKENINGFFFNNANDLCEILVNLFRDKNIIRQCGDINFENRGQFSWAEIIKKYQGYLEELLKK